METLDSILSRYDGAFYLFDIGILKDRVRYLRQHLPEKTAICYAVKANPFIIGEIAADVDRLEICSPGEYEICRKLRIPSEKMVISGVNKSEALVASLIGDPDFHGILTVESLWQMETICRYARDAGRVMPVLLRLTNGSQFGINAQDILDAFREAPDCLDILGIQFFSGTQKQSTKKLRRELERLDELILQIETEFGTPIRELEYGTGFPVPYFDPDSFDEDAFLGEFSQMLVSLKTGAAITLEIGRSIAASCGRYFTQVVDKKTNKGQNYALIDGGMHHLVYFGQHMAMSTPPFFVWGKEQQTPDAPWTICGSLCSMNDISAKQVPLPDLQIGDIFCFQNTGAYCMTEGIALFLSRDLPAIYLQRENGAVVQVRKRIETSVFNTPELRGEIH